MSSLILNKQRVSFTWQQSTTSSTQAAVNSGLTLPQNTLGVNTFVRIINSTVHQHPGPAIFPKLVLYFPGTVTPYFTGGLITGNPDEVRVIGDMFTPVDTNVYVNEPEGPLEVWISNTANTSVGAKFIMYIEYYIVSFFNQ